MGRTKNAFELTRKPSRSFIIDKHIFELSLIYSKRTWTYSKTLHSIM